MQLALAGSSRDRPRAVPFEEGVPQLRLDQWVSRYSGPTCRRPRLNTPKAPENDKLHRFSEGRWEHPCRWKRIRVQPNLPSRSWKGRLRSRADRNRGPPTRSRVPVPSRIELPSETRELPYRHEKEIPNNHHLYQDRANLSSDQERNFRSFSHDFSRAA